MSDDSARRWRLALGRYADKRLGGLSRSDGQYDAALDWLYGREYAKRGIRGGAGTEGTQFTAHKWLGEVRNLFPESVAERIQADALHTYDISELLNKSEIEKLPASTDTLRLLLSLRGGVDPELKAALRQAAQRVIDEIMEKLKSKIETSFSGRKNRFRRSNVARAANFDARATLRTNLASWDPERQRIIADRLRFNARVRRNLNWKIVLCVDQSGSMTDSLIHSAVMAAIFSGLPGVDVKMVLFDTTIVDVSDKLEDPLETLLSIQLGGGTDIGRAVTYCEDLVSDPSRTVFVLVTDFFEGGSVRILESAVARLVEARVRTLGLTALDDSGRAFYDHNTAARLAGLGMEIGAMTPDALANWLSEVMS